GSAHRGRKSGSVVARRCESGANRAKNLRGKTWRARRSCDHSVNQALRICEDPVSEIQNYRDLEAWQVGMRIVMVAYAVTNTFPPAERFGLTSQMRRAAVSVPSNIAEGQVWNSPGVFLRHIRIALGSLAELDTQFEAAIRLSVSVNAVADLQNTMQSSRRLLYGLRRAQRRRLG